MGQIEAGLSLYKNHWVLDNDFSFVDNASNEVSVQALENIDQLVKLTKSPFETILEDETELLKKTEVRKRDRVNFKINLAKTYGIINRRVYTKKTHTWKGVITSIEGDKFSANLYESGQNHGTYETAEFSIDDDISEEDKSLVTIGAVFYWSIGNIVVNGTQKKESVIRMRRVVSSVNEVNEKEIDKEIDLTYGKINWE